MLSRRDIAPVACYGLLFAAVVLWGALWSTGPNLPAPARAGDVARQLLDVADDQPEIRRLAKHMRVP